MARSKDEMRKVEGEWIGTTIPVDGGTITPVVRVNGMVGRGPQDGSPNEGSPSEGAQPEAGEYVFGWLRVQPLRATVVDAAGRETVVRTDDLSAGIQRNMALAGALLAAVSVVVILVRKLVR